MNADVQKNPLEPKKSGGIKEIISILAQALILALVIRTFLFQPFTIPSGSMRPTLLVGDYLFVSKYAYGYSKYSMPFSPDLFSGRIWGGQPKRGDIVVFRYTTNNQDYIKRVIGLPGDRIQMKDGVLYINEQPVKREKVGKTRSLDIVGEIPGEPTNSYDPARDGAVSVYRETLDNGVTYDTLDILPAGPGDNTSLYEVPQGYYFMMGDNRDNSEDSRFSIRYVKEENLIGRANLIFFSIGGDSSAWQIWRWPLDIRWNRIFSFVQTIKDVPPGP